MSGGHFDYKQYHLGEISESIQRVIEENEDRWKYSDDTIAEFKGAVHILKMAQVYAHRIDWLLSADDGEKCFHERLSEELGELNAIRKKFLSGL